MRQSFLEAVQESSVRLVNLYVKSSPPFALTASTAIAPAPAESSIDFPKVDDDEARYINYLEIYKSDVWMYNVTLEGASQASVEGVNILGASSTTGRAYAEGACRLVCHHLHHTLVPSHVSLPCCCNPSLSQPCWRMPAAMFSRNCLLL